MTTLLIIAITTFICSIVLKVSIARKQQSNELLFNNEMDRLNKEGESFRRYDEVTKE